MQCSKMKIGFQTENLRPTHFFVNKNITRNEIQNLFEWDLLKTQVHLNVKMF